MQPLRPSHGDRLGRARQRRWRALLVPYAVLLVILLSFMAICAFGGGQGTYTLDGRTYSLIGWATLPMGLLFAVAALLATITGTALIVWGFTRRGGPRWVPLLARGAALTLLLAILDPRHVSAQGTQHSLGEYLLPIALILYVMLFVHWLRQRRVWAGR